MRHRVLFSLPLLLVIGLTVNGEEGEKKPADLESVLEGLPEAPEFTLVDGERTGPAPVEAVPPGDPQALEPGAAKRLLDRLPALPKGGEEDFAKREGPPPPERTGETLDTPFPPPQVGPTPEAVDQGPLQVLRYQPEGEVPLVPRLSLTFSQPMVPVGSLADLAQEAVPARLEPQPPGSWRWIGTKTLLFEPEGERFPMSTDYTVTVPAGVKAQSGEALAEEVSFRFSTPTVKLESGLPRGNAVVEPTIVLRFNQRIDAQALLPSISLEVANESLPVRLATADELDGLAVNDRCLVLRPQQPLPNDVQVQVHVQPGATSAEGPRPTAARQTHSFRTFGPLKVVEHESGYNGRCPPGAPFKVRFNNQLDPESIDESAVSFEPEIPHYAVRAYGQRLFVQGLTRANTRYTMTLAAGIADRFGQTLGAPVELEFQTTAPEPRLVGDWNPTLVLDPAGQPEFRVQSVAIKRLRVRVHKVDPVRDWRAARAWRQSLNRRNRQQQQMPGEELQNSVVEVEGDGLEWVETKVDLSAGIEGGLGHCLVLVESADETEGRGGWRQRLTPWIQGTHLGIDAMRESNQALVRVTRLSDGAPVEGAKVELFGDSVSTDANGLALISELVPRNMDRELLIARKGADVALLPGNWRTQHQTVGLRWFTFDDRHLYRPQEQVRIKGWVRRYDPAKGGDVLPLGGGLPSANYQVHDARGREIAKGRVELDAFGGFDLAIDLPDNAHVGHAYARIGDHTHTFQIAEFRRPEFEVGVEPGSGGPHLFGDALSFTGEATYFAGGGLPGASLNWSVRGEAGDFTPPNCVGFRFGRYRPWWYRWHGGGSASHSEGFSARTDGTGKHTVAVDLKRVSGIGPVSLTATASVTDVNRQTWTGSSTVLVHPSRLYVGVRPQRPFVPEGKPLAVDAIAVDLDGERVAGRPLKLTFERLDWRWVKGVTEQFVAEQHTVEVTSGKGQVPAAVKAPAGGLWRVVAEVRDDAGRPNRTTLQIWVAGGQALAAQQVEEEQVTLIPDKERYAPGETAKVLVVSPFFPAEALVTWRRSGVVSSEVRKLEQATAVLEVPVTDDYVPGLTLHVSLVGAAPRAGGAKDRTRPAFASGAVELEIPPTQRTLGVVATPAQDQLAPGAHTSVDVVVTDPDGAPLPDAQVALCVVDEAVLFLAGYTHPDPLSQFYASRGPGVSDTRSRHMLRLQKLTDPSDEQSNADGAEMDDEGGAERLAMSKGRSAPAPGAPMADGFGAAGAQGGGGGGAAPVALRKDLRALAVFTPAVRTDAQGKATVEFQLPDSLTRYRVVAMAADAVHAFGKGESTITARLPLMVRPSAPRFLNFGDRCELPVVLQNQTDAALEVQVGLRGANLDVERSAYVLEVPANDRREVRFPVAAAEAGTARVQVIASAGDASDAQELTFPVWTPATSEAFATYGVVDEGGVVQPVRAPSEVWSQFGGLEVTTSSTALQSLTDAVIYLVEYPYGCAEQVASRVIALAALRDVLSAFDAEGLPSAKELQASVGRDLERLAQLQNRGDGGWGFWTAQDRSWPYLSIHVVHALALAKAKGYAVDERSLQRGFNYLRQIKRHIPATYSQGSKWALRAYALHVRAKLNDPAPGEALALFQEAGAERLSLEALGWIYPLLRERSEGQAIRRHFGNTLRETAGAAHFVTSYEDGEHVLLHSARRVDGVVLEALLSDPAEARGELAPKLVEGLLAHKKRGRWYNTQENAFVLLALDRYFRTAEAIEPDFVARAWLGEAFAGEHAFRGRTTERARIDVPMRWLQEAGDSDLVLAKDGPGRLYYRIGMRYAPKSLDLEPLSAGFTVERGYEAVDDPADVSRDEDGTWRVKAGARVRVRVTMVAPSRRYHVALVDPLPAGLEPIDPGLPAMGSLPADPDSPKRGGCWWWTRTWYEHSGLRDERAEAFTSYLWAGVHTYNYVTRATTPGEFVVPPAKAEEMYAPETFGRSATDTLVVR